MAVVRTRQDGIVDLVVFVILGPILLAIAYLMDLRLFVIHIFKNEVPRLNDK